MCGTLKTRVPGRYERPCDPCLLQFRSGLLAAACGVMLLIMWGRHQQIRPTASHRIRTTQARHGNVVLTPAHDSCTMEFEVCNGFTNQRIALLTGSICRWQLSSAAALHAPHHRLKNAHHTLALQGWCLRQRLIVLLCCQTFS